MAKKGKPQLDLANPARIDRQNRITELRLLGKSVADIAREIHMSKATVSRELKMEHVKDAIEDTVKYLSTFHSLVEQGHIELLTSDIPEVRQKAIDSWYKVMGVTGIQPPVIIQKMLAIQNNVILSPHVQRILSSTMPDDFIDVTPYEDTTKSNGET